MIFNQLVQENCNEVVLRISKETYELFLKFIDQQPQQKEQLKDHNQGFLRRITQFFMNQFYLWSQENEIECVRELLFYLKQIKQSKQKKFELGDLQKIFREEMIENYPTSDVQEYWKHFLSEQARERLMKNNKVKKKSIEQYLTSIPLLLDELKRKFPYNRLLSKYREDQNSKQSIQQEVVQINENDLDLCSQLNYQNSIDNYDSQWPTTITQF